jgi:hypothetical protein
MKFKSKNLREIAECIIGEKLLDYKSSRYISEFFEDCGLPLRMMVQHVGLGHQTDWQNLLEESCLQMHCHQGL